MNARCQFHTTCRRVLPALLWFTAFALLAPLNAADKIVVKGSDTLGAKLMPRLKEEFVAQQGDRGVEVTFEIAAEGSRTGITAIIDGTADLAMSSREVQPTELIQARQKGINLRAIPIGVDGIAIIVNEKNPITSLTSREVEMIFTGDIEDWSAITTMSGKISPYTRNTSSGTYSTFQDLALYRRNYSPRAQKLAGNEQIAAEVAANPYAIGYVGLAYTHTPGVKVVPIDGKLPTDYQYPYARPLYFYIDASKNHPDVVQEFIDFTLSPKGQEVVESVDFLPVSRLKELFPELASE